jgi:hypothetical protein
VQEHRGDQRCGFLDTGKVVGGHPGGGLQQRAEYEDQLAGGEVSAERPVVDAALQQGQDPPPYLLFHGTGVVRPVCVDEAGVLTAGQQVIAEFGIGLAVAVLLDAFILRTILVPAVMHLSGRANWWLPGWLDRILPHISIEPGAEPAAVRGPAPALEASRSMAAR